ncbi:MAG TPA: SwmB domain-containing protein, partial [bacterium]|nr:SwmB domain-containing protein [bacterium]
MKYKKHISAMVLALFVIATIGTFVTQRLAESATSYSISVGGTTAFTTEQIGTTLYTVNLSSNNVSVIDTVTKTLITTIPVGSVPRDPVVVGTDIYVANSGANTVSVIDTNTNTVTDTITVGTGPSRTILVGTDVYTMDWTSNAISVIDTNTKTVSNTIVIGVGSKIPLLVGTKLYISNTNLGNVTVIDTLTKTVITTLAITQGGFKMGLAGTKVYVSGLSGALSNKVVVIDTLTDTVVATIPVNAQPWDSFAVGTELFVTHYNPGNVSVVDTSTDTVTSVIPMSHSVSGAFLVGTKLYAFSGSTNQVSVIDTVTKSVIDTVAIDGLPRSAKLFGSQLYVATSADSLNIINTNTDTLVEIGKPVLTATDISGSILTLTYDEALDTGSNPSPSDYSVTVNAVPVTISAIQVVNANVVLILNSTTISSDVVQLSYTVPVSNPVQDVSGNDANSFAGVTATQADCSTIQTGSGPYHGALVGTKYYVYNYDYFGASSPDTISVIDTVTNVNIGTITVGNSPRFIIPVG